MARKKMTSREKTRKTTSKTEAAAGSKLVRPVIDDKLRRRAAKLFSSKKSTVQVAAKLGIPVNSANSMYGAWTRGSYDKLSSK